MKQLVAGIVILAVVGIGAFVYRNALEHPATPSPVPPGTACPADAKLCPDGTSLGRTGPSCAFAPCPFPNVELEAIHVALVVPTGYAANAAALGTDKTLVAAYEKPVAASSTDAIVIREYPIAAGKTATSTMLANTMYESSGMQAKSLSEFKPKIINGMTFRCVTLERFEGQVHTACYLPRAQDVLRFEVLEKGVDWTNPKLDIDALPEHQAFYGMLSTLMLEG